MVFNEQQKIKGFGIKVLMGISTVITLGVLLLVMFKERSPGFTEYLILVITLVFMALVYWLIFEIPAYTRIDRIGIHYKYQPWVWKYRLITWQDIERVDFKSISPISDYGGWGYRMGSEKKGNGIIMGSDGGFTIVKKRGKPFTITTTRKHDAERSVKYWMKEQM